MTTNPTFAIALPTYREEENIANLIEQIYQNLPQSIIIIVDDSPDNKTVEVAKSAFAKISKIGFDLKNGIIEKRSGKLGRVSATFHAMRQAYAMNIDYVIEMDTDLSHPPAQLQELYKIATSTKVDLIICSRDVKGGKIDGWPLSRHILHFAANEACRQILRIGIRDYMNAYRLYSRKAVNIALTKCGKISTGFWAFGEILANLKNDNCTIKEIPTHFTNRIKGQSNVSFKVILGCFFELIQVFFLLRKLK